MNDILVRISSPEDAPPGSYLLYDMSGGTFYVQPRNYTSFALNYLCQSKRTTLHYAMDLTSIGEHILMFDIDAVNQSSFKHDKLDCYLHEYVTKNLLPAISICFHKMDSFFLVVATRPNNYGCHVYFPEIVIAHDDYVHLCQKLRPSFEFSENNLEMKLDCPFNFTLPRSCKPNEKTYRPSSVIFCQNNEKPMYVSCLEIGKYLQDVATCLKQFGKKKHKSLFYSLIQKDFEQFIYIIDEFMMPIPSSNLVNPVKIGFYTVISTKDEDEEATKVASFYSFDDLNTFQKFNIYKGSELVINQKDSKKVFKYLRLNNFKIEQLETNNHAIKRWHKQTASSEPDQQLDSSFRNITSQLKKSSVKLSVQANPLAYLMEQNDCFSFLPIFYALYNKMGGTRVFGNLRLMLSSEKSLGLLNLLQSLSSDILKQVSSTFTEDTIKYCSFNWSSEKLDQKEKMRQILIDWKPSVLNCSDNVEYTVDFISRMIKLYFPICSERSSKKKMYVWNCTRHFWQELHKDWLRMLITSFCSQMKKFLATELRAYKLEVKLGAQEIDRIYSDLTIGNLFEDDEVKTMNQNKWIVSTSGGMLDLLTRQISLPVPEHYNNSVKIGISIDRSYFSSVVEEFTLFEVLLWSDWFMQEYRAELEKGEDDDYYGRLVSVLEDKTDFLKLQDEYPLLVESMLNFYINVCKFMNFEMDRIDYLMTILSSVLIATNFMKMLVIFQGQKNNGKTKLMKMLENMLGSYCIPITPQILVKNIQRQTMSDFALNIYTRRVLLAEELAGPLCENTVKQVTGNNSYSCRAIFQVSNYGVPTAKIFATTNRAPACVSTSAFVDRVVPFNFYSSFVTNAPSSAAEQIKTATYKAAPDDSIISNSIEGMFYLLLLRMFRLINRKDGYIDEPVMPTSIVEFKNKYLEIMDIYVQFKVYIDIQDVPGEVTTFAELKSAVRRFLVGIKKNDTIHESVLIERFDHEYSDRKEEDEEYYNDFAGLNKDEEQEETFEETVDLDDILTAVDKNVVSKKRKVKTVIYYKDIKLNKKR